MCQEWLIVDVQKNRVSLKVSRSHFSFINHSNSDRNPVYTHVIAYIAVYLLWLVQLAALKKLKNPPFCVIKNITQWTMQLAPQLQKNFYSIHVFNQYIHSSWFIIHQLTNSLGAQQEEKPENNSILIKNPPPISHKTKQNTELSDYISVFSPPGYYCTDALSSLKYCNYDFILNGDRKTEMDE